MRTTLIDQSVTIAGIKFSNTLMNGAYIGSKTVEEVYALINSASGAVVVGSISVKPRKSNPGQGYWEHKEQFYSLNSYGMPNGGLPYYKKHLAMMADKAHEMGKPLIANIVGFSNDEFVELTRFAQDSGADMVELNLGCPNVWEDGKQKRIISYHPDLVKELLVAIKKQNFSIKICLKISPLPPDILQDVAKVITSSKVVQVVTATNSYPNAATSSGTSSRSGKYALAGLSGRALKPISLGVVRQLRQLLPTSIDIIGCGGISTSNDVSDYLEAGASAVQIATALVQNGPAKFNEYFI